MYSLHTYIHTYKVYIHQSAFFYSLVTYVRTYIHTYIQGRAIQQAVPYLPSYLDFGHSEPSHVCMQLGLLRPLRHRARYSICMYSMYLCTVCLYVCSDLFMWVYVCKVL